MVKEKKTSQIRERGKWQLMKLTSVVGKEGGNDGNGDDDEEADRRCIKQVDLVSLAHIVPAITDVGGDL